MKCDKCGQEIVVPPKEIWVNVYGDTEESFGHASEFDADKAAGPDNADRIGNRAHRYVLAPEKPAKPRKKARKP